jgi:hypothetical protein
MRNGRAKERNNFNLSNLGLEILPLSSFINMQVGKQLT